MPTFPVIGSFGIPRIFRKIWEIRPIYRANPLISENLAPQSTRKNANKVFHQKLPDPRKLICLTSNKNPARPPIERILTDPTNNETRLKLQ